MLALSITVHQISIQELGPRLYYLVKPRLATMERPGKLMISFSIYQLDLDFNFVNRP